MIKMLIIITFFGCDVQLKGNLDCMTYTQCYTGTVLIKISRRQTLSFIKKVWLAGEKIMAKRSTLRNVTSSCEQFHCGSNKQSYLSNRSFYSCVLSYLAMNVSDAGGDLALIPASLLFSCKCQLVSIRTT